MPLCTTQGVSHMPSSGSQCQANMLQIQTQSQNCISTINCFWKQLLLYEATSIQGCSLALAQQTKVRKYG